MTEPSSADVDLLLGQVGWLRQLARQLSGDPHLGDDLAQDAWVAALTRRPSQERPLGPWLAHVVRNLLRDSRRNDEHRRQREHVSSRDEATTSAAELVERAELHRRLVDGVLALEEPYRSAILMRYLGELSPQAIAGKLGVPDRTVHTRLARGLDQLRRKLRAPRGERSAWIGVLLGREHFSKTSSLVPITGAVLMNAKWMKIASIALFLSLLGVWEAHRLVSPDPKTDEVGLVIALSSDSDAPLPRPAEEDSSVREAVAPPAVESLLAAPNLEHDLHGLVVTPEGDPIEGAEVRVFFPTARHIPTLGDWRDDERSVATQATNARGEFLVLLNPGSTYDLEATADGRARRRVTNRYPGEFVRVVLDPEAVVFGRVSVVENGSPVEGTLVSLEGGITRSEGDAVYTATTDGGGGFRIGQLPPGFYWLDLRSIEHPAVSRELVLESGEERRLDVTVEQGTTICGRVTDGETELPIAGARIALDWMMQHAVTSDETGEYLLRGVTTNASVELHVQAAGYGDWTIRVFSIPEAGAHQDLFLLKGRVAKGRVVDRAGRPVEDADVCAESRHWASVEQTESRHARAKEDGSFALDSLRVDGRHTLVIRAEGFATAVYDFPASEWESMQIDFGDILLAPPSRLGGRVIDPLGAPLSGLWALLDIEPTERDRFGPALGETREGYASSEGFGTGRVMARTDERGRFFFDDMPAGSYDLSAGDKGYLRRGDLHLELGEGEQREDVDIVFDMEPSISGTLVDVDGRALPKVAINLYRSGLAPSDPARHRLTYNWSTVDGTFVLHGLVPGTYDLEVRGQSTLNAEGSELVVGWSRWKDIAAGTSDLRLEVARGSHVEGRVMGPDGTPVPGCVVSAFVEGETDGNFLADAEGRFRIPCPEGRPCDLVAWPTNGQPGSTYPVLDENGAWDMSYNGTLTNVLPGTPDIVIRLTKLP